MKKVMFMFISLLTVLGVCSCNDNEVIEPVVSDSVSDMEVLSRFVDVNEITNEYYFNENKKTRALSYVTGSDWQDLEKVSPLSIEKYKNNLQVLKTLSKILCKWKQDSAVSLFLYLDSVFKNKHKLIHNQAPVMNRLCPFLLNLHK